MLGAPAALAAVRTAAFTAPVVAVAPAEAAPSGDDASRFEHRPAPTDAGSNAASTATIASIVKAVVGGQPVAPFQSITASSQLGPVVPVVPDLTAEPVLVSLCRETPDICIASALTDAAQTVWTGRHAWYGRVTGSTRLEGASMTFTEASASPSSQGGSLAGSAPFNIDVPDTGEHAGSIAGNLRDTLRRDGLAADIPAQLQRIFAGRLDTRAKARDGDTYRIVYEAAGASGSSSDNARVKAVDIRLGGVAYRAVWFVAPGRATGDYYSFDARRITAQPFSTPVNFRRISSAFGYRTHPISGERLMHTGVDLAAPSGTPVVAAAPGIVAFIGADGGYGNHVVIRHAQGYTTYYAHLSGFASGLHIGDRVTQGQRLGAVGSTGSSTGPHLHFEVRLNRVPTDPLRLTSRIGALPLAGAQRHLFDVVASNAMAQLDGIVSDRSATRTAAIPTRAAAAHA
ncbi:M23 family metallopeptidase [Paraburkholderia sp.]|uniref:M23 family metallopeptidase n=1 Tax=Paraburkholderia sp. TaxID=1926495 RepID=UPI0023A4997A|nr:M23 family metallopeptidase [Paraburkholderia sp.]MDE1179730.1 M23 family metallopeptidase [Paraburkholderia sp.]